MHIGTGAVVYRNPGDKRPTKTLYDEAVETAVKAEANGYDFCWTSEHHFENDQWNPSPLVVQTAIAMRTSTIGLGTNVIQAPYYHPLRLAEDVATIDILSGGRMTLGAGTGSALHEFETYNVAWDERHGRTFETMEVVKGVFDSAVYDHKGKYFDFPNIRLTTRPMQRKMPLFVAAHGPKNMRRTGKMGLGLNTQPAHAWYLDEYFEGLKEGGHSVDDVNMCAFGCLGVVVATKKEGDEIREKAQNLAAARWIAYSKRRDVTSNSSFDMEKEAGERDQNLGALLTGPIGTPDEVLKGLEEKYKSSYWTHAIATGTWGPFGSSDLWLREVAPVLRAWGRNPVGTEIPPEVPPESQIARTNVVKEEA